MKKSDITICTNCKFRTTDGCGPGQVMMCGHPYFRNTIGYEAAIIGWENLNGRREAVSYKCPKLNKLVWYLAERIDALITWIKFKVIGKK